MILCEVEEKGWTSSIGATRHEHLLGPVPVHYRRTGLRVRVLLLPCDHAMITSQDRSLLPQDMRLATRYPPLWFTTRHGAAAGEEDELRTRLAGKRLAERDG